MRPILAMKVWAALFAVFFVAWFVAVGTHPILRQGDDWFIRWPAYAMGGCATGFVVACLLALCGRLAR